MKEEEYKERVAMIEAMLKYGMNKSVVQEALDKLNLDWNSTYSFDIKCDFCNAEVKNCTRIPNGWLSGRMFRRKEPAIDSALGIIEKEFIRSPVACPEHKRQLHLLTMEVEDV
jgi:hypothetical protein